MKWIAREHVKVDRVAYQEVYGPEAELHFVQPERVVSEAESLSSISGRDVSFV